MKVIADLCVIPVGVGVSVSEYVTACEKILKEAGLETRLHAYGTNIEGEWDAVFAAGWDEQALHDAIMVVCCFNFMSRLPEGHGVEGPKSDRRGALFTERGRRLKEEGYLPLLSQLKPAGGSAAE